MALTVRSSECGVGTGRYWGPRRQWGGRLGEENRGVHTSVVKPKGVSGNRYSGREGQFPTGEGHYSSVSTVSFRGPGGGCPVGSGVDGVSGVGTWVVTVGDSSVTTEVRGGSGGTSSVTSSDVELRGGRGASGVGRSLTDGRRTGRGYVVSGVGRDNVTSVGVDRTTVHGTSVVPTDTRNVLRDCSVRGGPAGDGERRASTGSDTVRLRYRGTDNPAVGVSGGTVVQGGGLDTEGDLGRGPGGGGALGCSDTTVDVIDSSIRPVPRGSGGSGSHEVQGRGEIDTDLVVVLSKDSQGNVGPRTSITIGVSSRFGPCRSGTRADGGVSVWVRGDVVGRVGSYGGTGGPEVETGVSGVDGGRTVVGDYPTVGVGSTGNSVEQGGSRRDRTEGCGRTGTGSTRVDGVTGVGRGFGDSSGEVRSVSGAETDESVNRVMTESEVVVTGSAWVGECIVGVVVRVEVRTTTLGVTVGDLRTDTDSRAGGTIDNRVLSRGVPSTGRIGSFTETGEGTYQDVSHPGVSSADDARWESAGTTDSGSLGSVRVETVTGVGYGTRHRVGPAGGFCRTTKTTESTDSGYLGAVPEWTVVSATCSGGVLVDPRVGVGTRSISQTASETVDGDSGYVGGGHNTH